MRISDWSSDVCSSDLIGLVEIGDASFVAALFDRRLDDRVNQVAVALFGFEEGGIKGSGRGAVGRYFRRLLPVSVRIGVEVVARLDAGVHRRLVEIGRAHV